MDFIRLTDPAAPEFETAFALYEVSFPLHERPHPFCPGGPSVPPGVPLYAAV